MRYTVFLLWMGCGAASSMPPTEEAWPPRIVVRTPAETRVVWGVGPDCTNGPLRLQVEDLNVGDTLRSLWIIDEARGVTSYRPSPVTPNGSSRRTVPSPSSEIFSASLQNLSMGTHTVTVYVADGEFLEYAGPPAAAVSPGVVDQHVWVLDVVPCP